MRASPVHNPNPECERAAASEPDAPARATRAARVSKRTLARQAVRRTVAGHGQQAARTGKCGGVCAGLADDGGLSLGSNNSRPHPSLREGWGTRLWLALRGATRAHGDERPSHPLSSQRELNLETPSQPSLLQLPHNLRALANEQFHSRAGSLLRESDEIAKLSRYPELAGSRELDLVQQLLGKRVRNADVSSRRDCEFRPFDPRRGQPAEARQFWLPASLFLRLQLLPSAF